jgi:hypothetical protein
MKARKHKPMKGNERERELEMKGKGHREIKG